MTYYEVQIWTKTYYCDRINYDATATRVTKAELCNLFKINSHGQRIYFVNNSLVVINPTNMVVKEINEEVPARQPTLPKPTTQLS